MPAFETATAEEVAEDLLLLLLLRDKSFFHRFDLGVIELLAESEVGVAVGADVIVLVAPPAVHAPLSVITRAVVGFGLRRCC